MTALRQAIALAASDRTPSPASVRSLGGAWIPEEALAIGVYCALVFPGPTRCGRRCCCRSTTPATTTGDGVAG